MVRFKKASIKPGNKKCQNCDGKKKALGFDPYRSDSSVAMLPCKVCRGTGRAYSDLLDEVTAERDRLKACFDQLKKLLDDERHDVTTSKALLWLRLATIIGDSNG